VQTSYIRVDGDFFRSINVLIVFLPLNFPVNRYILCKESRTVTSFQPKFSNHPLCSFPAVVSLLIAQRSKTKGVQQQLVISLKDRGRRRTRTLVGPNQVVFCFLCFYIYNDLLLMPIGNRCYRRLLFLKLPSNLDLVRKRATELIANQPGARSRGYEALSIENASHQRRRIRK
jgi:hypothetical protein